MQNSNPALDALMQLKSASPASLSQMPATPYSYAMGGMIGQGGAPVPMQQPMQAGLAPPGQMPQMQMPQGQMQMPQGQMPQGPAALAQINQEIQQNPQLLQAMAQDLMPLVQSGQVNPQQIQMAGQLAEAALQNPELYPQIRQFAIQQGMSQPQEIPEQFDQNFLVLTILSARAIAQYGEQGAAAPMQPEDMMNYADGGYIQAGQKAKEGGKVVGPGGPKSDNIPIMVSPGEYVIPAHIVQMKGKEFFDSMLTKYSESGNKK
jgi:hypothetical protein